MKKLVALTLVLVLALAPMVLIEADDSKTVNFTLTLAASYEWSIPETVTLTEEGMVSETGCEFNIEVTKYNRFSDSEALCIGTEDSPIVCDESGYSLVGLWVYDGTFDNNVNYIINGTGTYTIGFGYVAEAAMNDAPNGNYTGSATFTASVVGVL